MPLQNINGTMLYYEVSGQGIPIVFIHPPLLTSANFKYQQEYLSHQFQVITFDIRGHGRSHASPVPITYELIAQDIIQLLDHLQIQQAFVTGYSTGGSVALKAMLDYPDRFAGGILISAMSEASDMKLRSRIKIAMGLSAWNPTLRLLMWGIAWGNSDQINTFRYLLSESRRGTIQNIHEYYQYSLNYSCTDQLARISSPVLMLYGAKDKDYERYRKILQHHLRQWKLVILQQENHQLPTKAAAEINRAIKAWILEEDHQKLAEKTTTSYTSHTATIPQEDTSVDNHV
ncbi:alpha/beta fold hydrolase [Paenibacillus guangzhouensis]|uniref:alpha/beta fold hydrolase n=1 Tax=Paenibacillus guangzhouensis TaxID=1473112 RepID=UPI0012668B2C|nr:alpha/beta hydrolase [Paenibacillus guangzhouensis]